MTLTTPAPNATATLLDGLKRQEDRVSRAASDIVSAFAASQNALAGSADAATNAAPGGMTAVMDRLEAGPADTGDLDVLRPSVSILEAKQAYAAAAKALNVVGDIQRETVDRLGHRTRVDA